ncbi:MAG: alcohol dehydrogenase [Microbacterium sp. 71-36]|uniref:quinone oxidoreductase family protein n=1 Tax=unclassified Microbacterium TaxID=2609290 RepID=UPI00086B3707|nr:MULTISPECIES: NADP-dependent oxidoreductase [unclassified Microbacterium]MBN9211981.1 NADP-dependent oxidoreductase [Microbacterium sp.]ODT38298.1 MAG: alcohol dehydrogenase [Microbacterium sp. SCN 71-17]OJV77038.1 MAG: alcohol dehydrogenase [Microbacterium sp. 71-36]
MAKQWRAHEAGPVENWTFDDVDVPAPGPGEVTIRVRAAGINPADAKHVASERPGAEFPVAIGYELSGEIAAIGPDAIGGSGPLRIGDEVVAFRVQGAYATELTVPARDVFAKPATLSHAEAANLLLAGTTAAEMIQVTRATAGETVLLHAASGAVGVSLLQQARVLGIRVIGTVGPDAEESAERVRRFGGIPVAYGEGLQARVVEAAAGEPIAAAWDAVGTDEAIDVSLALVAERDRIVTIVAPQRAESDGILWVAGARPENARFRDIARAHVLELAASGDLEVPVARTFALADAREAVRFVMQGHPGGRVALLP